MKIKYTLIQDVIPGTEIKVNTYYDYFKKEVILENQIEKDIWNKLKNQEDILKFWFELNMTRNAQFQKDMTFVKLNNSVIFTLPDDFTKLSDKELKETANFLKNLKFEPQEPDTTIIKM